MGRITRELRKEVFSFTRRSPAACRKIPIFSKCKGNLLRWIARDAEIPVWREWIELLNGALSQVPSALLSPDERGTRLR